MKPMQWISVALALSVATAGTAWADRDDEHDRGRRDGGRGGEHWEHEHDRGHGGHDADWLGIPLGILLFADVFSHPPHPDQPPPVIYQPSYYPPPAPVYVPAPPPPVVQTYWYFCPSLGNYYPYVRECPGAWQPVVPQPYQR
jgi:hypothetical protein